MRATELLKQVNAELMKLPAGEREKFFDGIRTLEDGVVPRHPSAGRQQLQWPDIHVRHRRIFGDAVLQENIVLVARDEEEH